MKICNFTHFKKARLKNLFGNSLILNVKGSIMALFNVELMKFYIRLRNVIRITMLNPLELIYYYGPKINTLLVQY